MKCTQGEPPLPASALSPTCSLCLAQFSGDYLPTASSCLGIWKSQQPSSQSTPPKELPKSPGKLGAASPSCGSRPCRNWEGVCLLGSCPVLSQAGPRASPSPSPTDTQGFILSLCHGNSVFGLPYSHGLRRKNNSAFSLCGDQQS